MKNRGLASGLVLLISSSFTRIFLIIFGYDYLCSRKIIIKEIESNARNLAGAAVNKIDVVLSSVEKIPKNLSCFPENSRCPDEELNRLLLSVVENTEEIYGSTVAFEPWACDAGHNPLYRICACGDIEKVETTGNMALRVVNDHSFRTKRLVLHKGDVTEDSAFVRDGISAVMQFEDTTVRRCEWQWI